MCGGGKKRKNRVVSLILREGSTLWLLVLLMFTIATNGGMGIEEEERQREGEGGAYNKDTFSNSVGRWRL